VKSHLTKHLALFTRMIFSVLFHQEASMESWAGKQG